MLVYPIHVPPARSCAVTGGSRGKRRGMGYAFELEALRDRAGEAGLPGSLDPTREDLVGDLRATSAG